MTDALAGGTDLNITLATTDDERAEVQALFEESFTNIDANAVPKTSSDYLYNPLVAQVRDEAGRLVAAALTCRSQRAAAAVTLGKMTRQDPLGVLDLVDRHSELDLIAVRESRRGIGIGSHLVRFLEGRLTDAGVQAWFGNVVEGLDATRLREFYTSHGFEVLPDGQPLPRLLGRDWTPPVPTAPPIFVFYKMLGGTAAPPTAPPRSVVRPPDPAKARRTGKAKAKKGR